MVQSDEFVTAVENTKQPLVDQSDKCEVSELILESTSGEPLGSRHWRQKAKNSLHHIFGVTRVSLAATSTLPKTVTCPLLGTMFVGSSDPHDRSSWLPLPKPETWSHHRRKRSDTCSPPNRNCHVRGKPVGRVCHSSDWAAHAKGFFHLCLVDTLGHVQRPAEAHGKHCTSGINHVFCSQQQPSTISPTKFIDFAVTRSIAKNLDNNFGIRSR